MRLSCVRALRIVTMLSLCLSQSWLPVSAADQVLVGASGMKGIQLDTWATGSIPAIQEGQRLRLSRLHFDACTGVALHNTGGSVLVYSETTGVKFVAQGGESVPNEELAQGESFIVGPQDYYTIVNDHIDPAFAADLLILSVTDDDSFVDVPVLTGNPFTSDHQCSDINPNGKVVPTILGEGKASADGDSLYIGSAFFFPGATTDGWGLINEGSSFNFLIQAGGMNTAGPNSGRAAFAGPGTVLTDYYLPADAQIQSYPFVNDGPVPILGLVFGTIREGDAVWMPRG